MPLIPLIAYHSQRPLTNADDLAHRNSSYRRISLVTDRMIHMILRARHIRCRQRARSPPTAGDASGSFAKNGKKPKGSDEHDSKSRAQTRLGVAVDIREISAQMKKGRNKEGNAYRSCEAGDNCPPCGKLSSFSSMKESPFASNSSTKPKCPSYPIMKAQAIKSE